MSKAVSVFLLKIKNKNIFAIVFERTKEKFYLYLSGTFFYIVA